MLFQGPQVLNVTVTNHSLFYPPSIHHLGLDGGGSTLSKGAQMFLSQARWLRHLIRRPPGLLPKEVRPTTGQTQNALQRLYFLSGLRTSGDPPGTAVEPGQGGEFTNPTMTKAHEYSLPYFHLWLIWKENHPRSEENPRILTAHTYSFRGRVR